VTPTVCEGNIGPHVTRIKIEEGEVQRKLHKVFGFGMESGYEAKSYHVKQSSALH